MTRLFSLIAVGVLCSPLGAQQRTGDAAVSGPVVTGPNVNTTPSVGTSLSPNINVNTGVDLNVNTGVSPTQGAMTATSQASRAMNGGALHATQTGPAATNLSAQARSQNAASRNQRGATQPNASHPNALHDPTAIVPDQKTAAPTGTSIDATSVQLRKAQQEDAAAPSGDGAAVSAALKKVFDASVVGKALGGPGAVAGKVQVASERIEQTASVAEQAAPQDAADLYKAAVDAAHDAARQNVLSEGAARKAVDTVMSFARRRAASALPQLASAAYGAAALGGAGAREMARALKGLDRWEALLGKPGQPLVANAKLLKADVARVHEEASRPGAKVEAPTVHFAKQGESFLAQLPTASIAKLPESLAAGFELKTDPTAPLSSSWLDDVLVEHARNPAADPSVLFEVGRRGAKRAVVAAAASAAQLSLRALVARFWFWLKSIAASLLGRGDALSVVRRAPTQAERAAVGDAPGSVALDLARFNAPYLEAQRLLGDAVPTAASAKAALAAARRLAEAHNKATGDSSGASSLEKLERRVLAEDRPSSTDLRLLSFWVERLHASSMGAVLSPLAQRAGEKPVVFFDLTPGAGMVGVVGKSLDAEALSHAGFDVRGAAAVYGPGGSAAELSAALDAALGRRKTPPSGGEPAALGAAVSFAQSKPHEAEAAGAAIQSDLATGSLTFLTVGRVPYEGGALTVSRAVRATKGGHEELYLMAQPSTGRVFGFKAPAR